MRTVADLYMTHVGEDVFVVGSGPSLRGFDFERLKGRTTIGLNHAICGFDPTYHLWCDTELWKEFREFNLPETTTIVCPNYKYIPWEQAAWAEQLRLFQPAPRLERFVSLSELYIASTSAVTAIQLAWKLGAKRVFLLGIDGKPSSLGEPYFYRQDRTAHHPYQQWNADIIQLAMLFVNWGIYDQPFPGTGVFNLNPDSAITAWEKVDPVILDLGSVPEVSGNE